MGNSGLIRRDYYNPLLKALFGRLDGTPPTDLNSDPVLICDFIKKDGPFPYIEIGVTETPALWDCKQQAGEQVLATIRV